MKNEDIAIIGMGAHYPGALDIKNLWENIISRREQFRRFPDERLPIESYSDLTQEDKDKSYVTQGAFLDGFEFDWLGYRVPKKTIASTDIVHWLAYEVSMIALKDAGYTKETIAKEKTGVIVGNTLTGEETRISYLRQRWPYVERVMRSSAKDLNLTEEQTKIFIERSEEYYKSVFPEMTEDSLAGGLANTIAGRICNAMDLHGGGFTVDGACSSSLIAVSTAAEKLSSGILDIAIAGGVDVSLDTFEMVGFARTGALTPDIMRVYDKRGNGFMPGEGCGLIIMKRLSDAKRDGDKIYATIKGWGISSDGKGSMTAPNGTYQGLALSRAYDLTGFSAKDLDFVEGHGTGTTVGDREELKGIALNVGVEPKDNLRSCGVTSFKSLCGHTKAASGIGGLIKTAIALNQRVIPPSAGCEDPNPFFNTAEGKGIYPILFGESCDKDRVLKAGVSAMGFGGINTHVFMQSEDAPFEELKSDISENALLVSNQNSELIPLSANSKEELLEQVKTLKEDAFGMSNAELTDLAAKTSKALSAGKFRVSIIAGYPDTLQNVLASLIAHLESNEIVEGKVLELEKGNILLSASLTKTKLGFVYPGQGSQQLNMAHTLVNRFEWAKEMLDKADKVLKEAGWEDRTLSGLIYYPTDKALDKEQTAEWFRLLTNTDVAQPAICFASALWTERLKRLGLNPDVVGGHSLGELSAFSSAGAFDYKSLIALAQLRGDAMQNTPSKGSMVAILSSLENVESMMAKIDGYLTVANINGPLQIVVSGENEAIDQLVELSLKDGIRATKLNVSNAFHTKMVDEASKILHENAPIPNKLTSNCKIISSVTTQEVESNIDMVNYFGNQVLEKVDFVGLVNKMKSECDLFVEVGTGRVLSGMISYIDKDVKVFPVEAEARNDLSLNRTLAYYFVSGGTVNWDELYASRLIREFVPSRNIKFIESACEKPFDLEPLSQDKLTHFNTNSNMQSSSNGASLTEVIQTLQLINDSKIIDAVNILNGNGNVLRSSEAQTIVGSTSNSDIQSNESTTIEETTVSDEKVEEESAPKIVKVSNKDKIKAVLLAKIEKMTGFPIETLDLDLKLLDDLNLDSIKATELIAETTEELGLEIELDPSPLANATLEEIIDTLNEHMPEDSSDAQESDEEKIKEVLLRKIEAMTGFPVETLDLDLKLLDDLNLDSIKATELIAETTEELGLNIDLDPAPLANATLEEIIAVFVEQKNSNKVKKSTPVTAKNRVKTEPWVRNFIMTARVEELRDEATIAKESRVLIVSEDTEQSLSNSLSEQLKKRFNVQNIEEQSFGKIKEKSTLLDESNLDYIFVILPRANGSKNQVESLSNMIERLSLFSKLKQETTVCFAQFAGGLFATDPITVDMEATSSVAWASSLHLEQKGLKIRVVDFAKSVAGEAFAEKVLVEVSSDEIFDTAGYQEDMERRVFYPEVHHKSELDAQSTIEWSDKDMVIVTGGAKGITSECAIAFAKETGVKMALLGSSKKPAEGELCEINTTLNKFKSFGLEAEYYACNISDRASVHETVKEISEELGNVTAVIHGAAANNPSALSYVSSDAALAEVSPKLLGAMNLLEEFKERPLKMFTSLTSIIGVTGMIGNGWYGFSNELLDILIAQYQQKHPQTKVVSVAYSVWAEIGMGAKMGSTDYLERMGIMAIPPKEGIDRFLGLVLHDVPQRQVVITAKLEGLDTWKTDALAKPSSNRFLETMVYSYPKVNVISEAHLTLEKDPYLKDHIWKGSNLFPTVFGLEAMSQVVAYAMGLNSFKNLKIEDIKLERPIVVNPEKGTKIQINALVLEKESNNSVQKIKVGISTEATQFTTDHFTAVFVLEGAGRFQENLKGLPELNKKRLDIDLKEDVYTWLLFHGPLFQRLSDFYQLDYNTAVFDSLTKEDEEREWMLGSPYLRDSLLQSVQPMVPSHTSLPVSIDRLFIANSLEKLPQKIRGVSINNNFKDNTYETSVFALADDKVYEKLEGYNLKILEHRQEFPDKKFFAQPEVYEEVDIVENQDESEFMMKYIPRLSNFPREERHEIILTHVQEWLEKLNITSQLIWDANNKPHLTDEKHTISISHTDSYLFMQISTGMSGCDVEKIVSRVSGNWKNILNLSDSKYQLLINYFQEKGDTEDRAGTRLWSIRESIYKAVGEFNGSIELISMNDSTAHIRAEDLKHTLDLISSVVKTKRGMSCIVSYIKKGIQHDKF